MARQHNPPVTIQVYLGSGKSGAKLRENMESAARSWRSLSEMVVALLKKADPVLFKGVKDGQ